MTMEQASGGVRVTQERSRLARGLVSGLLHEAFGAVLSFAAMILLVRLLTPQEYGQAAAAVAVLAFLGAFRGAMFVEHAMQHTKDVEPAWDTYFVIGGLVQGVLCLATLALSAAFVWFDALASLAPLLQVAAIGFVLDWPAQIATVKLRRELRFDYLKLLFALSLLVRLSSSVLLAWLGLGAMALVISGNVLTAVPFAGSLFLIDKWRPRQSWRTALATQDLADVLRFGAQQIGASLLQSLRTAAEALILTKMFGAATFGLLNRASALYQTTIGRLGLVFMDTAYPLLPLERGDRDRYAHRATRFIEGAVVLSIPGAAIVALEGAGLSRLFYGTKWSEADPFLAPAAIAVAATALTSAAAYVLMGAARVTAAVAIESIVAVSGLLALVVVAADASPAFYLWTLAALEVVFASVSFTYVVPHLEADWHRRALWPAVAASAAGCAGVVMFRWTVPGEGTFALLAALFIYGTLVAATLALTAPSLVLEVIQSRHAFVSRTRAAAAEVSRVSA